MLETPLSREPKRGMTPGLPSHSESKSPSAREDLRQQLQAVIRLEAEALLSLTEQVSDAFVTALEVLYRTRGKVILTGVGKSGLVARKIAATMNSTGTSATFMHPSDALHGDLGVLSAQDVVLAIGKSGESDELTQILPAIRRLGAKIIALTAVPDSTLGRAADVILYTPITKEACPLDLAPTVSTTVALAVGDALAMTLMKMKNFKSEDFAKYHPGGKLGKRLLLQVKDLMIPKDRCPILTPQSATMEEVIAALGKFGLGIVLFSDDGQKLAGVLTDGDIRRLVSRHRAEFFDLKVAEVMNRTPIVTASDQKAVETLALMEERKSPLNVLPIVDDGILVGVARLHELLSVA